MKKSGIDNLIDLIEKIEVTEENKEQIKQIKNMIEKADYTKAISILNQLRQEGKIKLKNFVIFPKFLKYADLSAALILHDTAVHCGSGCADGNDRQAAQCPQHI